MIVWTVDLVLLLIKMGYYTIYEGYQILRRLTKTAKEVSEQEQIEYLKRHIRELEKQLEKRDEWGFILLDYDHILIE